jgi:hypothetical protein
MEYVLLGMWILVPVGFYLLSLWSWLEQSTVVRKGKKRNEEPKDLLKQAVFLTIASFVTYLFDLFIIQGGNIDFIFGPWVPKPMVRFFLYPIILYIGAVSFGGTKRPKIDRLPRPSEKYRGRNR